MRSMQEDMISWQQDYRNEEEQFQELQDQLLQEVPLVETERVQNEGTIPPVVSTPLTTQPKMPTIVENLQCKRRISLKFHKNLERKCRLRNDGDAW